MARQFPDMGFKKGKKVYVDGARGPMGPWEIVEVLGNGQYKLKDGDEVMQKIFEEKDLSEKPRVHGDE
jgi:protein involved in polysaccharide export with SLBB domain